MDARVRPIRGPCRRLLRQPEKIPRLLARDHLEDLRNSRQERPRREEAPSSGIPLQPGGPRARPGRHEDPRRRDGRPLRPGHAQHNDGLGRDELLPEDVHGPPREAVEEEMVEGLPGRERLRRALEVRIPRRMDLSESRLRGTDHPRRQGLRREQHVPVGDAPADACRDAGRPLGAFSLGALHHGRGRVLHAEAWTPPDMAAQRLLPEHPGGLRHAVGRLRDGLHDLHRPRDLRGPLRRHLLGEDQVLVLRDLEGPLPRLHRALERRQAPGLHRA